MEEVSKKPVPSKEVPGALERPEGVSDEEWNAFCAKNGLVSMTMEEFVQVGEKAKQQALEELRKKRFAAAKAYEAMSFGGRARARAKLARKARKKARR